MAQSDAISTGATGSILATADLTKRYGRLTALERCTLTIRAGEVVGLLGPNGAGKTTLIRLLMGYLRPTAGWARIAGLDCYRDSVAVHRQVAYLPGEARLDRQLTGRQVLQFLARIRPDGNYARAEAIADRLELDLTRPVALCSTGMRQKLALAATLASQTALVILDEPTSNLDPTVRTTVLTLIREAQREGRTVLLSSHVLSETEQACDRVCILRAGQLVHVQVMAELRRQHRIRARLAGPLPALPPALADQLTVTTSNNGHLTILTPGELSPLLGWLASVPMNEVRIEPIGLQAVYQRFHPAEVE